MDSLDEGDSRTSSGCQIDCSLDGPCSSDENFLPSLLEECIGRCKRYESDKRRLKADLVALRAENDALNERLLAAEERPQQRDAETHTDDCAGLFVSEEDMEVQRKIWWEEGASATVGNLKKLLDILDKTPGLSEGIFETIETLVQEQGKLETWSSDEAKADKILGQAPLFPSDGSSEIEVRRRAGFAKPARDLEYWTASYSVTASMSDSGSDGAAWRTESGNSFETYSRGPIEIVELNPAVGGEDSDDQPTPALQLQEVQAMQERHEEVPQFAPVPPPEADNERVSRKDSRSTAIVDRTLSGRKSSHLFVPVNGAAGTMLRRSSGTRRRRRSSYRERAAPSPALFRQTLVPAKPEHNTSINSKPEQIQAQLGQNLSSPIQSDSPATTTATARLIKDNLHHQQVPKILSPMAPSTGPPKSVLSIRVKTAPSQQDKMAKLKPNQASINGQGVDLQSPVRKPSGTRREVTRHGPPSREKLANR